MVVAHYGIVAGFVDSENRHKNPPFCEMKKASGFFENPTLFVLLIRLFDWPIHSASFPVVAMQVRAKRVPVVKQICILPGFAGGAELF